MIVKPPWEPIVPKYINRIGERSPDNLKAALSQLKVSQNPRYTFQAGRTYCNIFVWDATIALDCEVPHYLDNKETTANQMIKWLEGEPGGWRKVDHQEAEHLASFGHPVIVTFFNTKGHGHMAMMLPNGHIAQAGIAGLYDAPVKAGFGDKPISFFAHE